MDDKSFLIANINVLDTPKGRILLSILESNPSSISFRTAGFGETENDDHDFVRVKSFQLTGVHAISATEAVIL